MKNFCETVMLSLLIFGLVTLLTYAAVAPWVECLETHSFLFCNAVLNK